MPHGYTQRYKQRHIYRGVHMGIYTHGHTHGHLGMHMGIHMNIQRDIQRGHTHAGYSPIHPHKYYSPEHSYVIRIHAHKRQSWSSTRFHGVEMCYYTALAFGSSTPVSDFLPRPPYSIEYARYYFSRRARTQQFNRRTNYTYTRRIF